MHSLGEKIRPKYLTTSRVTLMRIGAEFGEEIDERRLPAFRRTIDAENMSRSKRKLKGFSEKSIFKMSRESKRMRIKEVRRRWRFEITMEKEVKEKQQNEVEKKLSD